MNVEQVLKLATAKLKAKKISPPYLEAEILLSAILKKPREFLIIHPEIKLTVKQIKKFQSRLKLRLKGLPIAYLTGQKEFYGLNFQVNKNVLIPRPETELLVEESLKSTANKRQPLSIIDIGTGSGCIAITMAKISKRKIMAVDISKKALTVAWKNARLHKVDKKIKFIKGNLLSPFLNSKILKQNSEIIILANLPYLNKKWKNLLKSSDSLSLKYEPKIALEGGADGLDLYRKLAEQIKLLKNKKITLLCEVGHLHSAAMKKIFSFAKKIQIKKDLAGLDRLAIVEII